MRTKLQSISDKLATTDSNVVIFQENWLNKNIDDAEITSNTDFVAHRMGRSEFINKKQEESLWYWINLSNKSIKFEVIVLGSKTHIECQGVRLSQGDYGLCILNVYCPGPPYGSRTNKVTEIITMVNYTRREYPNDKTTMVGDFNLPALIWEFNHDGDGYLSVTNVVINQFERNCTQTLETMGLYQINANPSSNAKYLDLVLTTEHWRKGYSML